MISTCDSQRENRRQDFDALLMMYQMEGLAAEGRRSEKQGNFRASIRETRPCATNRKHRESLQEWRFRANLGGHFGGRGSGTCGISEIIKRGGTSL